METTDILEQKSSTLEVTGNAKTYLSTAASWAKFYAILSFIGIGFLLLGGLIVIAAGESMSNLTAMPYGFSAFGWFYIVLAVIMFFPALYLLRFSQKTKEALIANDSQVLEVSFQNMKSYWKFIGIMTIVLIAFFIIVFPIMMVTAAAAATAGF